MAKRPSLLRKLLWIGLLLLLVPLATPLIFRQASEALLEQQKIALARQSHWLTQTLATITPTVEQTAPADASVYIWPLQGPQELDGFASEWTDQALAPNTALPAPLFAIAAGHTNDHHLALWVSVHSSVRYCQPGNDDSCTAVGIETINAQGVSRRFDIAPLAPGLGQTATLDNNGAALRYYWHDRGALGFQLELQLPRHQAQRLLLRIRNNDQRLARVNLLGNHPALTTLARTLIAPGQHIRLIDRHGYLRATSHDTTQRQHTWLDRTLARLLAPNPGQAIRVPPRHTEQFDLNEPLFRAIPSSPQLALNAGNEPLLLALGEADNGLLALIEEPAVGPVQFARSLAGRWFATGLLLAVGIGLLLLGFGLRLVWRLRRLGRQLDRTLDNHGRVRQPLPAPRGADELDRLHAALRSLLHRTSEQQDYLSALGKILRHELRTPLSVMMNSLENIGSENPNLQTARDAGQRLRQTLNRMAEAADIETAIGPPNRHPIDLAEFIQHARDHYLGAYPEARIESDAPTKTTPACTDAELLAQALDKLVDNAVTHHRPGSTIRLQLQADERQATLLVGNVNGGIPASDNAQHLQLGLLIVKRIAETLGGEPLQKIGDDYCEYGLSVARQCD